MGFFHNLSVRLDADTKKFSAELAKAGGQMQAFAEKTTERYKDANAELKRHTLGLKDTARIVQGIVISQAFYGVATSIRDATRSLLEFNEQLDYANVTYTALFGSQDLAKGFVTALQEHSINTIFEYSDLADSAKKMLAYGIEYKNLMYTMEGLTNLGAMSGDAAALDRIALAMGQIKTTGYLAATEMRQLANAYVPIYDIIQDSFGLTGDQMKNVGDLRLPANDVLNAIVDYANEKFGDVGEAAMYTITGLKNRVVDTMKVLGSEMTRPLTVAWKAFLAFVADGLSNIREVYAAGGWGGVLEYLVPDESQQTVIRAFLANIHNLIVTIISAFQSMLSMLGVIGQTFMITFNMVAPVIMGVVNVLSATLYAISQNEAATAALRAVLVGAAGAFIILRTQALYTLVVTAVTKAINGLSKALLLLTGIISRHWLLFGLFALGTAFLSIAAASNNAGNSLSNFFRTVSGLGGTTNQDDVLKEMENDLSDIVDMTDEYNNRFGEGADAVDDLTDSLDKANKKARGLLSFDEVFRLPESSSSGSYSYSGLDDLENLMDGLDSLGGALIPEVPDFTDFINQFTDDLFGGLELGIMDKLGDAALGALIGGGLGAIFGGLLGGPAGAVIGAKIGALAGAIVGLLWDELNGALVNTAAGFVAGAGTVIASALAKAGAAGLGTVLKNLAATGFKGFFSGLANIIKNAGLKSVVKGGLIGMAIGLVVDGIAQLLWHGLAERFENADVEAASLGQTIGGVLGAVIGGLLGGPPGVLIGSAIGTFAGGFVGLFKNYIVKFFTDGWQDVAASIGIWYANMITGANATFEVLKTEWSNTWDSVQTTVSTKWAEIKMAADTWYTNMVTGAAITLATLQSEWTTKWSEIKTNALTKWAEISVSATTWYNNLVSGASITLGLVRSEWSTKWAGIKQDLANWWTIIKSSMGTWLENNVWKPIADFFNPSKFWERVSSLLSSIKRKFSNWWDGITDLFSKDVEINANVSTASRSNSAYYSNLGGHATGGIFNREHIARFAEGNKAEAIIPLENASAMQPFVDAIANGITASLMPVIASNNSQANLQPLYVGTLVADESGLKELERKMRVIRIKEERRGG